ncbi:hypothetical protein [Martelella alba]|uniref:Leucine rich repeat (LRR) protein n=1 Tax=Martelella alba TaxID=2590451 RepID=A0ABY2SHB4_9HYPH|nr:hypothetical protein [Martelella alba]TKI04677.1 hypothetical protein FCN80_17090 [Martelella alba]
MKISQCIPCYQTATEHEAYYKENAPVEERYCFLERWKSWAEKPWSRENKYNRRIAAIRMRIALSDSVQTLDLSGFGLTEIPPLPQHIQFLDLSHNRLKTLPYCLPPKLKRINLSHNQFTGMVNYLPRAVIVEISDNPLTTKNINRIIQGQFPYNIVLNGLVIYDKSPGQFELTETLRESCLESLQVSQLRSDALKTTL